MRRRTTPPQIWYCSFYYHLTFCKGPRSLMLLHNSQTPWRQRIRKSGNQICTCSTVQVHAHVLCHMLYLFESIVVRGSLSFWQFEILSIFEAQHWILRFEKNSRLEVHGQDSRSRCSLSLRRTSTFGMQKTSRFIETSFWWDTRSSALKFVWKGDSSTAFFVVRRKLFMHIRWRVDSPMRLGNSSLHYFLLQVIF